MSVQTRNIQYSTIYAKRFQRAKKKKKNICRFKGKIQKTYCAIAKQLNLTKHRAED